MGRAMDMLQTGLRRRMEMLLAVMPAADLAVDARAVPIGTNPAPIGFKSAPIGTKSALIGTKSAAANIRTALAVTALLKMSCAPVLGYQSALRRRPLAMSTG